MSPQRQRLGLYYLLYFDNIGQEEVCRFLRELLRHLRGSVIVLLDNSSTHHGEALGKLLDRHPRLHLEYFPSYAPELNPDEGVWSLAKRDLANGCPLDADELMDDVIVRSMEFELPQTTSVAASSNPIYPLIFCLKLLHYLCSTQIALKGSKDGFLRWPLLACGQISI